MHCIEEQLRRDEVTVGIEQLLAEAVFAGNALVTYNGASPYNARFGQQPALLPDIHALPDQGTTGRNAQRVREVALQKIIESTATARINRAMRTNTTAPGEVQDYRPGELVDFHRPPRSKDTSGWHGPAEVIENRPARGQVTIRWNREELVCRYADVRRFIDFPALAYMAGSPGRGAASEVLSVIHTYLNTLAERKIQVLGYLLTTGTWRPTAETRKQPRVTAAVEIMIRNGTCPN